MQKSSFVWDPVPIQRADEIPESFELTLRSILQEKYLNEDWTQSKVRQHIKCRYNLTISDRQITYRLRIWNMLKKDHKPISRASRILDDLSTLSDHNTTPALTEDHSSTSSVTRPNTSESFNQLLQSQLSTSTVAQPSPQDANSVSDPSGSEAPDSLPNLPVSFNPLTAHTQSITKKAEGDEIVAQIKSCDTNSVISEPCAYDTYGDQPLDQYRPTSEFRPLHHNGFDRPHDADILNPDSNVRSRSSSSRDPMFCSHRRNGSKFFEGMAVKMTDGPMASTTTSLERVDVLLGTLFKRDTSCPDTMHMSLAEMHSSLRLAIIMLCCGQTEDASCCLEFLLWCWNAQGVFFPGAIAAVDPLLHSTNILMWLMQTGKCDNNDVVCFKLWQSCLDISGLQECIKKHPFTLKQMLAVGRLALVAHLQGYGIFFHQLCEVWTHWRGAISAATLRQTATDLQKAAIGYINGKISNPHSTSTIKLRISTDRDSISAGITHLLRWMRKQLLLYPSVVEQQGINFENLWPHLCCGQDAEHLEQQMLLSYLSHRASLGNVPQQLSVFGKDLEYLPWSICLEWMLDEIPVLTLSILSSFIRIERYSPSDPITSEAWCTRMLDAVNQLAYHIKSTTARFCTAASTSCPSSMRITSPGQRSIWISPIKLNTHNDRTISGEDLQELTRHQICRIALFGSTSPEATQAHISNATTEYYDPTLLSSPRSSMSVSESMKSMYRLAKGQIKRGHASISTCSSLYLRGFNLSTSSMANSLFGSVMNMSQHSLRRGSWLSVRTKQVDEKSSISNSEDAMALDA